MSSLSSQYRKLCRLREKCRRLKARIIKLERKLAGKQGHGGFWAARARG